MKNLKYFAVIFVFAYATFVLPYKVLSMFTVQEIALFFSWLGDVFFAGAVIVVLISLTSLFENIMRKF